MPIESWTGPEETPELAAHATAMIDAALVGTGLMPDAYWAAVRKSYNPPYNDPSPRRASTAQASVVTSATIVSAAVDAVAIDATAVDVVADTQTVPLPVAALAALAAEVHAA